MSERRRKAATRRHTHTHLKGDARLQRVSAAAPRQIAGSVHGSAATLGCDEVNYYRANELEVYTYIDTYIDVCRLELEVYTHL